MSAFTLVGELPRHIYCGVEARYITRESGAPDEREGSSRLLPCLWFGLVSFPGRAWGCTVLLESGAVYRNVPAHALSCAPLTPDNMVWRTNEAQTWDCYGERFTVIEYRVLAERRCLARVAGKDCRGRYLFTAAPVGDGYSAYPEQAKEFTFVGLDNGRLTIQPTNRVLFEDKSFTTNPAMVWPTDLRRQTEIYHAE